MVEGIGVGNQVGRVGAEVAERDLEVGGGQAGQVGDGQFAHLAVVLEYLSRVPLPARAHDDFLGLFGRQPSRVGENGEVDDHPVEAAHVGHHVLHGPPRATAR